MSTHERRICTRSYVGRAVHIFNEKNENVTVSRKSTCSTWRTSERPVTAAGTPNKLITLLCCPVPISYWKKKKRALELHIALCMIAPTAAIHNRMHHRRGPSPPVDSILFRQRAVHLSSTTAVVEIESVTHTRKSFLCHMNLFLCFI